MKTAEWLMADGSASPPPQTLAIRTLMCFLDTAFLIMTLVPFRCSKCERIERAGSPVSIWFKLNLTVDPSVCFFHSLKKTSPEVQSI